MAKGYWVSAYRSISDPEKLAAYAKLAGPAITGGGGHFLARGEPVAVYEHGLKGKHRYCRSRIGRDEWQAPGPYPAGDAGVR
ncbi:MAG: DUF1330 domain-containing protein [Proteobacteria bacterium]|nr:DUF1330 domain-containing protein [Pseudomonadota bacterium]